MRVVTALGKAIEEADAAGRAGRGAASDQVTRSPSEIGIRDVTPYANIDSMMTEQQWVEMIRALRSAGGNKLFVQQETLFHEHVSGSQRAATGRMWNGGRSRS